MIQTANNVTQVEEVRMVFITHTVLLRNGKAYEKTTRLQPVYYLNRLNTCLLSIGEFLNDKQLITGDNHQLMFLRNKLPVLTCQPHIVGSTTFWLNSTIESVQSLSAKTGTVYAADYSIWHQHMGHPGDNILWKLPEMVKEAPKLITIPMAKKPCEACATGKMLLRRAERVSSVDQSISISTHRYEPQLESVYHAAIWTATGICCILNMSDHKDFGEAEPWSQDGDLRLESKVREETRCISLGQV